MSQVCELCGLKEEDEIQIEGRNQFRICEKCMQSERFEEFINELFSS